MRRRIPLALTATIVAAAMLSSCSGAGVASPSVAESSAPAPAPTSSASPQSSDADLDAAFAERDQFFRDQQFPLDGATLTAVTSAQQDFIAQQRAYIESQGAVWSENYETVYLALTADACETSILNFHAVDTTDFTAHVQSSPLVATLVEGLADDQREAGVRNLASIMVFGTRFLCPADTAQWEAAYTEVFG